MKRLLSEPRIKPELVFRPLLYRMYKDDEKWEMTFAVHE